MSDFQQQWQELEDKFIALTQREKLIIMVAAIFVAGFALYSLLVEPSLKEADKLAKQNSSLNSQIETANVQIAEIEKALKIDPNEKIKGEIEVIREQILKVDADLDKVMTEYIAPEQMAPALTDLLMTAADIRVVGMAVLEPELVQHNSDESLPSYYRHLFNVEIQGDYFALMEFVKKVSVSSSKFSVQNLSYQVLSYPNAVMTLTLITISDNEKVIRL